MVLLSVFCSHFYMYKYIYYPLLFNNTFLICTVLIDCFPADLLIYDIFVFPLRFQSTLSCFLRVTKCIARNEMNSIQYVVTNSCIEFSFLKRWWRLLCMSLSWKKILVAEILIDLWHRAIGCHRCFFFSPSPFGDFFLVMNRDMCKWYHHMYLNLNWLHEVKTTKLATCSDLMSFFTLFKHDMIFNSCVFLMKKLLVKILFVYPSSMWYWLLLSGHVNCSSLFRMNLSCSVSFLWNTDEPY